MNRTASRKSAWCRSCRPMSTRSNCWSAASRWTGNPTTKPPGLRSMRFDVITLFPELFGPFLASGVTRRAYASGQVDVRLWNPRDHAEGNYRRVDDRPFGGGPGMVMMVQPLARCLAAIRADRAEALDAQAPLVLFSPIGAPLDHAGVERWSAS